MNRLLLAVLAFAIATLGCASSKPKPDLSGAPRCLEYMSSWEGKGKPRDLEILCEMNDSQIMEFLEDYNAEP
jgi:hypothetical protein